MISAFVGREYLSSLARARQTGEEPQRVQVTRPPYPCLGEGALRIVGERQLDGQLQWVLAYERYCRLPDSGRRERPPRDERSRAAGQP